jgi:hypothetical protein
VLSARARKSLGISAVSADLLALVLLDRAEALFKEPSPRNGSKQFTEPGRYLVICNLRPHFQEFNMYGWVTVK